MADYKDKGKDLLKIWMGMKVLGNLFAGGIFGGNKGQGGLGKGAFGAGLLGILGGNDSDDSPLSDDPDSGKVSSEPFSVLGGGMIGEEKPKPLQRPTLNLWDRRSTV